LSYDGILEYIRDNVQFDVVLSTDRLDEGPYKKEDFTEALVKRVIFNAELYEDALQLL